MVAITTRKFYFFPHFSIKHLFLKGLELGGHWARRLTGREFTNKLLRWIAVCSTHLRLFIWVTWLQQSTFVCLVATGFITVPCRIRTWRRHDICMIFKRHQYQEMIIFDLTCDHTDFIFIPSSTGKWWVITENIACLWVSATISTIAVTTVAIILGLSNWKRELILNILLVPFANTFLSLNGWTKDPPQRFLRSQRPLGSSCGQNYSSEPWLTWTPE